MKIIKDLNPNKARGFDEISVKMIQLCGDSIIFPLKLIFCNALSSGVFPSDWKKGNITPVHKKSSKQILTNYRPISLLPIFGKIFEKLIYENLYRYFHNNKLLSDNQSGFRPGDSCVSQLIAITHEIYKAFDGNACLETRGVFLDMSKAFDKVWHKGLLFKLKSYGIQGNLYRILENYLHNRQQRVVLNGQESDWREVHAGVPQGSVLGPLLFLVYINDLPENLHSTVKLFADDTSIFSTVFNIDRSFHDLSHDLSLIEKWAYQWKMSFNPDPNKQATEVVFSRKKTLINHPPLVFNNSQVTVASHQKHLGLYLDRNLTFDFHLKEKMSKANRVIGLIKHLHGTLPRKSLITLYTSFARPHLDYADVIYDQPHNEKFCNTIESIQYNAALAITGAIRGTSKERLYQELGLESLRNRRWFHRLCFIFKVINNRSPHYLFTMLPQFIFSRNPDRNSLNMFSSIPSSTDYFSNSFFPHAIREWNKLGESIKSKKTITQFKASILQFIRPKACSVFNVMDPEGLKLLTRLRVQLSHLKEHKYRHNFVDTLNPICNCGLLEIESTPHYLLRCLFYCDQRKTLLDSISTVGNISNLSDRKKVDLILYGDEKLSIATNQAIIEATICFLRSSKRFEVPLITQL